MHIIKQLSEDEFVIKMDDYDLDRHDSVRIAMENGLGTGYLIDKNW